MLYLLDGVALNTWNFSYFLFSIKTNGLYSPVLYPKVDLKIFTKFYACSSF